MGTEMLDEIRERNRPRWEPFAHQIVDNRHLNRVLLSIPAVRRQEFYEAIRPYLKFEPKPRFSFAFSPEQVEIIKQHEEADSQIRDASGKCDSFADNPR